jgi:hypothetical protein
MELQKMREQVLSEMAHIPNWPRPQQSYLRGSYWITRMNSLGKKAQKPGMTAYEALEVCIAGLRGMYPNQEFQYDRDFFKPSKKRKGE